MSKKSLQAIFAKAANKAKDSQHKNSKAYRAEQARKRWEAATLDAEIAISKVAELSQAGAHCANDLKIALAKAVEYNQAREYRAAWEELNSIMAEAAAGIEYYSEYELDTPVRTKIRKTIKSLAASISEEVSSGFANGTARVNVLEKMHADACKALIKEGI
jgi:hypothetical protein